MLVAPVVAASVVASELPVQRRGKAPVAAGATPMNTALAQSYQNNPQLNAQRAATRAVDENVAIALGGYRPRVTGTTSYTHSYLETLTRAAPGNICNPGGRAQELRRRRRHNVRHHRHPDAVQRIPDRQPHPAGGGQVFAARETLRTTEQTVLLDARHRLHEPAARHRDPRSAAQQRRGPRSEQLRQTRDRFNVGEVTRTDVAQAESRLAAGRSLDARPRNRTTSHPRDLPPGDRRRAGPAAPAMPVDRFSPRYSAQRGRRGRRPRHPRHGAATYDVDVASLR